jgi:hypothetical protein
MEVVGAIAIPRHKARFLSRNAKGCLPTYAGSVTLPANPKSRNPLLPHISTNNLIKVIYRNKT